jgi:hypothetical protein
MNITQLPNRCHGSLLIGFLALLLGLAPVVHAVVDDAHTEAMDLAGPAYKKGFKIREDYWKGTAKPAERKSVKAQLFKGNEYWFWLGSDEDNVDITLDLFDGSGQKITLETISGIAAKGVRVVPPKTGTYVAVFTISLKESKEEAKGKPVVEKPAKICWALAYGWR